MQLRPVRNVLQRQDLTPETQRVARQQAQFGQRVDHQPIGRGGGNALADKLHRFAEFDLGRLQNGLLPVELRFERHQLVDVDAVELPAMAGRRRDQFLAGLAERDVKRLLAAPRPLHDELHGQRRLAGPRRALDQIEPVAHQPAVDDGVEFGVPGRQALSRLRRVVHLMLPCWPFDGKNNRPGFSSGRDTATQKNIGTCAAVS